MRGSRAAILTAVVCLPAGYFAGQFAGTGREEDRRRAAHVAAALEQGASEIAAAQVANSAAPAFGSLAGLTHDQVRERTRAALREPDRILRWKAWMDILAGMDESNAAAVSEGLMEKFNAGGDTGEEGEILQFREGQIFGAKRFQTLPAEPNGRVDWVYRNHMRGWASVSPAAARKWLDSLDPGSVQNELRTAWLDGLKKAAPATIAEVFPDLNSEQQRPLLPGLMNGIYDQGGLDGVRQWFDETGKNLTPAVAQAAFTNMAYRITHDSGRWGEAEELFKTHAAQPWFSPEVFASYNNRVAVTDPGRCLNLLNELAPNSPVMQNELNTAIMRTVEVSTTKTLNTLATWLNDNKSHPLFDQTAASFAVRAQREDPEAAVRWAGTIKDPSLRQSTLDALQGGPRE